MHPQKSLASPAAHTTLRFTRTTTQLHFISPAPLHFDPSYCTSPAPHYTSPHCTSLYQQHFTPPLHFVPFHFTSPAALYQHHTALHPTTLYHTILNSLKFLWLQRKSKDQEFTKSIGWLQSISPDAGTDKRVGSALQATDL